MITATITIQRLKIKSVLVKKVFTSLVQKIAKHVMVFVKKARPWMAAFLIVIGFTIWGTGDESLTMVIALLIGKLALIVLGVILLVSGEENEI